MAYTLEQLQAALQTARTTGQHEAVTHIEKLIEAKRGDLPSETESFLSGAGQGATFGFLDELQGFGGGVGTWLGGGEFGEGYERRRDYERDLDRVAEDTNPNAYLGGELSSALIPGASAFKAAKYLPKGLSKIERLIRQRSKNPYAGRGGGRVATESAIRPAGQLAVTGGVAGGAAGFGYSEEEDVAGQLRDAGTGALIGAAGAPLLASGLTLAGGALTGVTGAIGRKLFQDSDRLSDDIIRQDLEAEGFETAQQVFDEAQRHGGRLANVGPTTRGDAIVASKQPGPGRKIAQDIVEEDQAGQQARLRVQIEETMDSPWTEDFHAFARNIKESRKEQAGEYYRRAYAAEFQPSEMLLRLQDRPSMQEALKRAARTMEDVVPSVSSAVGAPRLMGNRLELFDQAKRELDDMIGAARSKGEMDKARRLGNMKREWVNELDELVPDYKTARGIYAGGSAMDNAAEFGREVLKDRSMFAADLDEVMRDMGEGEIEALRVGLVRGMIDILENTAETGNAARRVFGTKRHGDVIEKIYPNDASMGLLREAVESENTRSLLRNEVMGGSATAERLAAAKRIDEQREIGLANSVWDFVRRVYNRDLDPSRMTTDDYEQLSKKLFQVTSLDDIKRIMASGGRSRPAEDVMQAPVSATMGGALSEVIAGESTEYDFLGQQN